MKVVYQALVMLVLLAVGAYCVMVHDADGASIEEEAWLAQFGHYEYVLREDLAAGGLLVCAALVGFYRNSRDRGTSNAADSTEARSSSAVCYIQAALFMAFACIMTFESVAESVILCSEDQQLLSRAGRTARFLGYFISMILAAWSFLLGTYLWPSNVAEN